MKNFKIFLLNVPYDRKTEVLKGLTYHTYNRDHRVCRHRHEILNCIFESNKPTNKQSWEPTLKTL